MPSSRIVSTAIAILGLAFLAAYYLWTSAPQAVAQQAAAEANGPKLEFTISGESNGKIIVQLYENVAPLHAERLVTLAQEGAYDNVVFHRVIDGFMAQSGDVANGKAGGDTSRAGTGGSQYPNLRAEFSEVPFDRGTVGMARSSDPNSANSQFFIMFAPAPHLDGQYTVVGQVTEGLDVLDAIKRGMGGNGAVVGTPDKIDTIKVIE